MASNASIRRSQIIRTFGPGALIDLPKESAIMAGLDTWPNLHKLERVDEPRLVAKITEMTGMPKPGLYLPPTDDSPPWEKGPGVVAWRFPNWFVVQEKDGTAGADTRSRRSRRLVPRRLLDKNKFDGCEVVPTRFVQACPRGHIKDIDWRWFIHGGATECSGRQFWLDERGTGGDLADIVARCECGASERMSAAVDRETMALGRCFGDQPWLGPGIKENCGVPARLLLRTATNAYFAQTVSVLSLPRTRSAVADAAAVLSGRLPEGTSLGNIGFLRNLPEYQSIMKPFTDQEIHDALNAARPVEDDDRPVKHVELDAILSAPIGFEEDIPPDLNFHARTLPESMWRKLGSLLDPIESVVQFHRLREVSAILGFTRFEAPMPDINGEYDSDVEPARLSNDPRWFPAIENRGEGFFVQLRAETVREWSERPAVENRTSQLREGFERWRNRRSNPDRFHPVSPVYVMLHTFSHLLIQSVAMTCGYPASSIRERIYLDGDRMGVLLYTGTPDAEGTLGGLVSEARYIHRHVQAALDAATLCSNDPVCASHDAGQSLEERWLHGAACHGCCFIAETSCEMRNDHLDRALVVPTLGHEGMALFQPDA